MKTDQQFKDWLDDDTAPRTVLFQITADVGGVDTVRKVSTKAYNDYLPIVVGGIKLTQSISMTAEATMSVGDIELDNTSGEYYPWLDDVWVNKPILVYAGDVRWVESDFKLIFKGVIADINSKSRERINLTICDMMQRLNTPILEDKIGAPAPNPDTLHVRLLGEAHNITPKLIDPNVNGGLYEFNYGDSERLIETRDDAKVRLVTADLPNGRFSFNANVGPGVVTCSAQGVKLNGVYVNTVARLIQYLVTMQGKVSDRLLNSDIDMAGFDAFDAANQQVAGLYVPDRMNVIEACRKLASSLGAQVVGSPEGLLRIIQFAIPSTATTDIRATDRLNRSIKLIDKLPVAASVKLGYCKNWTIQNNIPTAIPARHKTMYATEWYTVTSAPDPVIKARYKLNDEPVMIETCLQKAIHAQAEADRRSNIVKVQRKTYGFEGTPSQMMLKLGQAVNLYSDEYNLKNGKVGIVSKLSPDWGNFHVIVEVTV